jgi:hypothetical protein
LVERIVADLRPVRRLWPTSLRLTLWLALEVGLLLFVVRVTHRTDLRQQVTNLWYLLGVGGFGVAAAIGAGFALCAAIPGGEPRPFEMVLLVALASGSALLLLHEPVNGSVPVATFIDVGFQCAIESFIVATLPWIALAWAIRRGAPLSAGLDGALLGAAAFFCSFALMRIICPIEEGLHLLTWHLLPALAGIALSALAGNVFFKRRGRTASVTPRR